MNQSTNIETVAQYFDAVRTAGVWIDNQHITSEGEGRSTRYFVDGEKASKSDARDAFDAARESGVAILVGDEANRQIRCLACGGSVGYLTGSHMKSHEDGLPQSIAEYRAEYGDDTPLAPDSLMEKLAEANRARWEAGEYDHLRAEA